MVSIPLTLQTVYQDLVQAWLDRPPAALAGTPHVREVGGRAFWYATVRGPGGAHRQMFLGSDTAEMRERIEAWREARADAKAFRAAAAEKVAALRGARLPALDMTTGKVLRALAQAGAFRLGGVLVGTHAFRLYDLELGVRVAAAATAVTADIDVAAFEKLSVAVEDHAEPELPEVLDALGLAPMAGLDRKRPTRWRMKEGDAVVDFLSPSFAKEEAPQKLEALGLWAQGLHFLNFLIRDPIPAVALYRDGVLLQIPAPERFAVHKLIVAARRKSADRGKATKDRRQAAALIEALAELRPQELASAYAEAREAGPQWDKALDASLKLEPTLNARLARL